MNTHLAEKDVEQGHHLARNVSEQLRYSSTVLHAHSVLLLGENGPPFYLQIIKSETSSRSERAIVRTMK